MISLKGGSLHWSDHVGLMSTAGTPLINPTIGFSYTITYPPNRLCICFRTGLTQGREREGGGGERERGGGRKRENSNSNSLLYQTNGVYVQGGGGGGSNKQFNSSSDISFGKCQSCTLVRGGGGGGGATK